MNNKMKKLSTLGVLISTALTLSGCAVSDAYDRMDSIEAQTKAVQKAQLVNAEMSKSDSTITVKNAMFFAGAGYKLSEKERLPAFFNKTFAIHQVNPISLQDLISVITQKTKMRIQLTDDALSYISKISSDKPMEKKVVKADGKPLPFDPAAVTGEGSNLPGANLRLSINMDGSLRDLLDYVTTKADLFWRYDDGQVIIYRQETKTFFVAVDPGKGSMKGTVNAGTSAGDGGTNSGSTHSTDYTFTPDSYWSYLDKTLKTMVSKEGRVSSNQVMGVVTVTDTPDRVNHIESYIKEINALANKRIAVSVSIYDIELTDTTKQGFDFDLSKLETAGATINSGMPSFTPTDLLSMTFKHGSVAGISAVMDMLAESGKVSEVTRHTVNTTNGISVPIQVVHERSYVKQQTVSKDADGGPDQVDVQTGIINEGISMSVLPRIIGKDRLAINFAADIGKIISMDDVHISNGGLIQLPQRSTKNFLQRLPLNSGETVMLVGFERTVKSTDQTGLPDSSAWMLGGKMDSSEKKVFSVVLVTPYILANK